jgi:GT2 family glycosyltransferase
VSASPPRVAAIALDYNGRDVTLQALASLTAQDYPACDVVVVDNGSTDGSAAAIRAAYPQVTVVRSEQNLGPSGGGNLGFRWALERGYDYALILNNDIEVAPDFVRRLVEAAESDPKIGIVGPKAYYYWQRDTLWSAGGRLRFAEAVTSERGMGLVDRGQFDVDADVEYVNGCAMLVKRRVFEEVGLWDPSYQLCFEDADFSLRARRAGWRIRYAHRARLWHMVSTSTGGYVPAKTFHSARSTALFVRRFATPWQRFTARLMMTLAVPVAFLRELPRGNQAAALAKIRGYREGFKAPMPDPPRWEANPAPRATMPA